MADETRNTLGGHARVGTLVQAGSVGELHVHEAPAPAEPPPCQLPPVTQYFEDREAEQATVLQLARGGEDGCEGPLLVALSGIGGVGKTALARRLARALQDEARCPDGILYVDLDDHRREGGAELTDILAELLRPLGVQPAWLAPSLAGRRKQWWERTQAKRLVVILDNVRYGTEGLLPASAGSVAVVISHGRLYDIEGDALIELPLAPLAAPHALRLLHRVVDDPRLAAEPAAADRLGLLCDGLPAALHVAARWVRKHRRRPLPRLVEELAAELQGGGLSMGEGAWDAAYRDLTADAARLYRLLAVHPGPSTAPGPAAALLGDVHGPAAADDALDELESASLLLPARAVCARRAGCRAAPCCPAARTARRAAVPPPAPARARRRRLRRGRAPNLADGRRSRARCPRATSAGALGRAARPSGCRRSVRRHRRRRRGSGGPGRRRRARSSRDR
ncbi:hypothetical protein [Streptomyces hypolithicus]